MIERGMPSTNIEYAEICKTVRKLLRNNIREYTTMRVKEALKTGKGLQKATNKEECKVMIPSLKEEGGSISINQSIKQPINQSINQTSIVPVSPVKPGSVARQPHQCSIAK